MSVTNQDHSWGGSTTPYVYNGSDINVGDYLINTVKIEKFITKKTKAIIPIHLYGQSADLEKILVLAKKKNIKVIEERAQAQGAKYKMSIINISEPARLRRISYAVFCLKKTITTSIQTHKHTSRNITTTTT